MLGSFGVFRALMDGWKTDLVATNFQRTIFWLTHDLTFEDNRLLAWLGSPIADCSQFVHLRAPEPAAACILQLLLRERHCWDTPGSRAEQSLYSKVSHPQCPFCHHTGLELALYWLYNTSTKSSSGSSSEMFYCFLLQHPRTICVDKSWALFEIGKHGHEAVKDWLPRGVSSRVRWGTRASAITVLSVVFLTWTYEREQRRYPIPGQIMTNS